MSWLYSQALVAEYSVEHCSGGAPSALLSGNPTPQAYLPSDRMMAFSRPSRFGMTFAPLTASLGAELLTWFLAASHARTSARLEKAPELTANAQVCGEKWRELSAKYDRNSSSWKTHRCLWDEDLSECSVILPKWGSMRDGVLSQLLTLAPHTGESGFGLWATPAASDANRGGTITDDMSGVSLAQMVNTPARWPTPKANDAEKRGNFDATNPRNGLPAAVKLWPTPLATDGSKGGPNQKGSKGDLRLSSAVHQFPTPTTMDHIVRKAMRPSREATGRKTGYLSEMLPGGQLNPTWVEWLMGWPLGWTDLKPSATDKSLSAQREHGEF
jgi:hypothetical protein